MIKNARHIIQHLIALLAGLILLVLPVSGQQATQNPYYFEGDDVVFVFDVRSYGRALQGEEADQLDFRDLKIYEVAITGAFNNWSAEGWKMTKRNEYVFELRKKIAEFNAPFPLEFKYVLNGKIISELQENKGNDKQFTDDFLRDVYRLDMSVFKENENGNIVFSLKGKSDARQVILSGSFNGWDEQSLKMKKGPDGWYLRGDLPPGRYEYKFIADGEWMHDARAKENVVNEHGTLNSVLYITRPVTFTLKGFPNASQVIVTGSFVDWNVNKHRMININGVWTTTVPLAGGKHHYKFIIDGAWLTDPTNPLVEDDGYGNQNSVLFVH